ncbi:MAG: segregation/condensation protein A [Gemmatimonadales bacterium]|nr:MAG: segregation/condensation protein A [Gemmatimonadales bacterium]
MNGADGIDAPFMVELERFHGPLHLLLHLIREQEFDIFDIPIHHITDQFLVAVKGIGAGELDSAGEFLEMAATLIRIKAQMLLPRPVEEDGEDPRAELVRRLLEYEQIREITQRMERAEAERARRRPKGYLEDRPRPSPEELPLETTWDEVLAAALGVKVPEAVDREHRVTPRTVSMEEKAILILERLNRDSGVEFRSLFSSVQDDVHRMHGVMTFLAGLELSRRRRIHLRQTRPFHELWLYRRDDPGSGAGAVADGFGDGIDDFAARPLDRSPSPPPEENQP